MAVIASGRADDVSGLIVAAAAGDPAAFATIVGAYQADMRRVCAVVAGDHGVADDAVASAWSIAWRKLGSLRDPARLRPWLVSIAVNEARQLLRAQHRRAVIEVPVTQVAEPRGGLDPGSSIDSIDLRNALARLDPSDRALLANALPGRLRRRRACVCDWAQRVRQTGAFGAPTSSTRKGPERWMS